MLDIDINMNGELLQTLHGLIRNWEHEVVEFKQASNDYKQHEIGRYFSAISNEANLKGLQYGWLVFGVNNKTREIVSTDYRDTHGLESLKHEIAQNTTGGITFTDIFEVYDGNDRAVMFKIPAAVAAIPTAWKGHYYGRDGESLSYLSLEELERLRRQTQRDWSGQMIAGSGINHLDKDAIRIARESYKTKQNREHISTEIDSMSDEELDLDKNYMRMLYDHPEFDLETVYLLDRVQKKLPLEKEQYKTLQTLGVIEGKAPNFYVSLAIAKITDERVQYTKNKAMDDKYYMDLIINYLQQFDNGTKADFIKLLGNKLSDVLNEKQKVNKVRYFLTAMHKNGLIERTTENRRTGAWRLAKKK